MTITCKGSIAVGALAAGLTVSTGASALQLSYQLKSYELKSYELKFKAANIADTTPGRDLWRYEYTLVAELNAYQGFRVAFDASKYSNLHGETGPLASAWGVEVPIQPNTPEAGNPGYYLASRAQPISGTNGPFGVSFEWLGPGQPSSQPYDVIDFWYEEIIGGGTTVPIPEPETYVLLASGLALVFAAARRRSASVG